MIPFENWFISDFWPLAMWILIVLFIELSCLVSSFSDFSLCFITKFNIICLIKSEPSLCSVPSLMFHIKTFWPRGMYVIFAGWFPRHCWEKKYFFLLPKTWIFLEYLIESVKVQFLSKIIPNRFRSMPEKYDIFHFVATSTTNFSVNI